MLGVDGCRGGWLVAAVEGDEVRWQWTARFADLLEDPAEAVAVDIPIGLPDAGRRACDVEARGRLGRRGVTVFAAPVRDVLGCRSYAEARALLAGRPGASMSAQAFGIVPAVRDVDEVMTPALEDRVVEAHPELAFARLAGRVVDAGKRTAEGKAARLQALRTWRDDVDRAVAAAPARAGADDVLDALACATVAQRWLAGEAVVLGDGARDRRGLLMRIAG